MLIRASHRVLILLATSLLPLKINAASGSWVADNIGITQGLRGVVTPSSRCNRQLHWRRKMHVLFQSAGAIS